MIFDRQNLLSDAQAITATAASTNVIDLGPINAGFPRDVGKGKDTPIRIQVVQGFNNLTSLQFDLQVADDAAFTQNVTTVWTSGAVLLALLIAGYVAVLEDLPRRANRRFMRLNYTVVGTAPTLGQVTAGITMGNQSNGE